MIQRPLKDFKRKKPLLYFRYNTPKQDYILIDFYNSDVNHIATNNVYITQFRDIVFGGTCEEVDLFLSTLHEIGYKHDDEVLSRQLKKAHCYSFLDAQELLIDWLIGEDDILF